MNLVKITVYQYQRPQWAVVSEKIIPKMQTVDRKGNRFRELFPCLGRNSKHIFYPVLVSAEPELDIFYTFLKPNLTSIVYRGGINKGLTSELNINNIICSDLYTYTRTGCLVRK